MNFRSISFYLSLFCFPISLLAFINILYSSYFDYFLSIESYFIPLALITTLVITVIKFSLALSLGLVGALSIVRFRAAIKEPEELVYLFFVISIGLSNGANQFLLSIFATLIILTFLFGRYLFEIKFRKISSVYSGYC